MTAVAEIRSFNRYYTRTLGLLNRRMPESELSLPEARVLYELRYCPPEGRTAADIGRALQMDKAHLSRILARFYARGLLMRRANSAHGRQRLLTLTKAGKDVFKALEQGTEAQIGDMVAPIDAPGQARLVAAMRVIRNTLDRDAESTEQPKLRALRAGDLGWIAHRQMRLYEEEYGWDWTYEGLVCKILGDFAANFDAAKEDGWVAEWRGETVGSIFLVKGDAPGVAKLRLLYVERFARGLGVGRLLVRACIARARALGYVKLTLWTNDVLVAARRIYESEGFRLVDEHRHHSFGCDLVGQTFELDL